MIANIRQLRSSTKEVLSAVSRGDTVFIFKRGKPCAKILPISDEPSTKISLAGMWKDNPKVYSSKKFIESLRKARYAH